MNRVHVDSFSPKYPCGKWSFDTKTDKLKYEPHSNLDDLRERYTNTLGFQFKRTMNQEEELIFRQEFLRSPKTYDSDYVVINDVRDLVLFLMPSKFLTVKFLDFLHMPAVHRLIHALLIYFEYFMRMVEYVLIRRDEISAQVQTSQTNDMKRTYSKNLAQYRMLVARNYSAILKGEGDMKRFYHMKEVVNISSMIGDRHFHEQFLAVAIQIVWISMHRRAYDIIEMEMCRLFCSEHFVQHRDVYLDFTPSERSLLYGPKNKIVNYRTQKSPLVLELMDIAEEDLPILWVGDRKYRGTDRRIAEIELEYITPGPQLRCIDVAHGILGTPKRLYNTLLELDMESVHFSSFTKYHDPYHLIQQMHLRIPVIGETEMRKMAKHYDHFYKVYRIYEPTSEEKMNKWRRRDKIVGAFQMDKMLIDIWGRCKAEVKSNDYGPSAQDIAANFFSGVAHLRKSRSKALLDPRMSVDSLEPEGAKPTHLRMFQKGDDFYFKH